MSGIDSTIEPERLREQVRAANSLAAEGPGGKLPFPVGPDFAASVGYAIEDLPPEAAAVFAGVSNVAMWAPIHPGMVVLDLGCGGGLDTLIAARRAGPAGRVVGLDFSMDFPELARVVKSGGTVAGAELVLLEPLADAERASSVNWFT
jgi:SAM-dependent methyltransferase